MFTAQVVRAPQMARKMRNPTHSFALKHTAHCLVPFAIAPVLPGDTLKNALFQARAVTAPIKSAVVGWWLEHYLFYVKHRDLANVAFENMQLDPAWTASGAGVGDNVADTSFYHPAHANNINWLKRSYIAIVENWFREEGVAWDAYKIGNYATVAITADKWWQSMRTEAADTADDVELTVGVDDKFTMAELDAKMRMWQLQHMQGLTTMSYEEFLQSHGVALPEPELFKPELLRRWSSWQYPNNTVNPTDGAPTSAVSWAVNGRADKDRFFKEPGFIVGVTCARPKVYMGSQRGNASAVLNDAFAWLPASMRQNAEVSQRLIANTNGLLNAQTANYWVDIRDLFLYGDQFTNFDMATTTDMNVVALPTAAAVTRYPTSTMTDGLFVGTNKNITQDGILSLGIASKVEDYTPVSG